jgi:hypothetical protein
LAIQDSEHATVFRRDCRCSTRYRFHLAHR